jgi:hypothetical protein
MVKKEGEDTSISSKDKVDKVISPKDKLISKKILLESIIKKADYYSAKNSVTDVDLYYIVKDFFKEFLDLKYEFSFDELVTELDKIYMEAAQRETVSNFILKIKLIEYDDRSFDELEIKSFIKEFSDIAKMLIKNLGLTKETFWSKLMSVFAGKEKASANQASDSEKTSENTENINYLPPADFASEKENNYQNNQNQTADASSLSSVDATNYGLKNANLQTTVGSGKDLAMGSTPDEKFLSKSKQESLGMNNKMQYSSISADNSKYAAYAPKKDAKYGKQETGKSKKQDYNKIDSDSWTAENLMTKEVKNNGSKESEWTAPLDETEGKKSEDTLKTPDDKKAQKSESSKKSVASKKAGSIENKQKTTVKKSASSTSQQKQKAAPSSGKDELGKLIEKAKKSSKKSEITELYKKINIKYESANVDLQARYYKDVMDIYKKLSKMK